MCSSDLFPSHDNKDDDGIIMVRNRQVTIRMLDKARIKEERSYWQFFNLGVPILVMTTLVSVAAWWRRRKYARY